MSRASFSIRLTFVLLAIALLSGCSVLSGKKGGAEGQEGLSEEELLAERERRFGEGSIPLAEGEGLFRDIRFDYDSSAISDAARQDIEYNVEILRNRPELQIQLEGHCDERGTAEYNLALGDRRSRAVRDVVASLGVSGDRISTISYGEEVPLDANHDEEAWAKNRRVHFAAAGVR